MARIQISGYLCEQCLHKWIPRGDATSTPSACPKCRSEYWWIPGTIDTNKQHALRYIAKLSDNDRQDFFDLLRATWPGSLRPTSHKISDNKFYKRPMLSEAILAVLRGNEQPMRAGEIINALQEYNFSKGSIYIKISEMHKSGEIISTNDDPSAKSKLYKIS